MNHLKSAFIHATLRLAMGIYALLMRIAARLHSPPRRTAQDLSYDILMTGTFYSDNWIIPHLTPLAGSKYCRRLRMVASNPVPVIKNVEAIYAPNWLNRIVGKVPARLLVFIWIAFRDRPDIVGGFHILPNGLIAALTARFISARSLYICGGGPRELMGGGYESGNAVFGKLTRHDAVIERRLLDVLSAFDLVVTMGSSAIKFFSKYAETDYRIVAGGFDGGRFFPSQKPPDNDLILIGRLSSVKRVDIFLEAVNHARKTIPDISAIVVGGGPLLSTLKQMAEKLGLKQNVRFVGHQDNVEQWLRRSKIFVLTSDSEGLAQVLIQAMLCGLPAVVSDVGDLGDLVNPCVNGYLVGDRRPEVFADYFTRLLSNSKQLSIFGKAAFKSAEKYKMANVVCLWDEIFESFQNKFTNRVT